MGKTSLFTRFNEGHFPETQATILDNFTTTIPRTSGPAVRCVVWDTAGQERFRSLVGNYFNGAKAVIIVYSITSKESFKSLSGSHRTTCWLDLVKQKCPGDAIVVIVGNKCDLDASREVTYEEGKEIADSKNALFFEASAKTGENVTKVFTAIANHLPDDDLFDEKDQQFEDSFRLTPPPPANPSKPNKCPC